jgi:exodeoxyribonuclease-3
MKVASWNVNSIRVRLEQVLEWLATQQPDVLGLQEIKMPCDDFPAEAFAEAGYQSVVYGQKTYNGVALLSKSEATDVQKAIPGLEDEQRRAIAATYSGGTRIINLYVPNGQSVGSDKYAYKLRWLEALEAWLREELRSHEKLVVMGDFNIAPDDRDVHDPDEWRDKILCSEAERAALQRLLGMGMTGCSTRQRGCSAGGTTAPPDSAATGACGSTCCWCQKPLRSVAPRAASTRNRASWNARRIMRRCGSSSRVAPRVAAGRIDLSAKRD